VLAFTMGIGDATPIGPFDFHADSARWGLMGHAARLFLSGGVREASTSVEIAYSPTDLCTYYDYSTPLLQLAYVTRLSRRYGGDAVPSQATLTVASGRTAALRLQGERRLLWNNLSRADLRSIPDKPVTVRFDGFAGDAGTTRTISGERLYVVQDLRRIGLDPVGVTTDGALALGFRDNRTHTWSLGQTDPSTAAAAAWDALGSLGPSHIRHSAPATGRTVSDTGQIIRDAGRQTISVVGEAAAAVAANRTQSGPILAGPLSVFSPSPSFAAVAVPMDNHRLTETREFTIRYATTCENTGQRLQRAQGGPKPYLLAFDGAQPASARPRRSGRPVEIGWSGRLLAQVYAEGGEFEFVVSDSGVTVVGTCPSVEVADSRGGRHTFPDGFAALTLPR
jgi:hypothetical protein